MKKKTVQEAPKTVCFMHCGYIAAWLEGWCALHSQFHSIYPRVRKKIRSFGMPCSVVETHCRAAGYSRCKFTAAHSQNISKHLPTSLQDSYALRMLDLTYPEVLGRPKPTAYNKTKLPEVAMRTKILSKTESADPGARRHSAPPKKEKDKVERAQSDLTVEGPKPTASSGSSSTPAFPSAAVSTHHGSHKKTPSMSQSPVEKIQKAKRSRSKSDLTKESSKSDLAKESSR